MVEEREFRGSRTCLRSYYVDYSRYDCHIYLSGDTGRRKDPHGEKGGTSPMGFEVIARRTPRKQHRTQFPADMVKNDKELVQKRHDCQVEDTPDGGIHR